MVSKEGPGGGPREAIPGGAMGGRRACVLTKRSQGAVEGEGERMGERARGLGEKYRGVLQGFFTPCPSDRQGTGFASDRLEAIPAPPGVFLPLCVSVCPGSPRCLTWCPGPPDDFLVRIPTESGDPSPLSDRPNNGEHLLCSKTIHWFARSEGTRLGQGHPLSFGRGMGQSGAFGMLALRMHDPSSDHRRCQSAIYCLPGVRETFNH